MSDEDKEIVALAKRFNKPKMIAAWLGVSVTQVHNTLHAARKHDRSIPYFAERDHKNTQPVLPGQIVVGVRLMPLLEREATRRGKSVQETARDLIETGLLAGASRHE